MPPIRDGCPCAIPSMSLTVVRGCLVGMHVIFEIHDSKSPTRSPAFVFFVKKTLGFVVQRMCRPAVVLDAVTAVRVDRLVRFFLLLVFG